MLERRQSEPGHVDIQSGGTDRSPALRRDDWLQANRSGRPVLVAKANAPDGFSYVGIGCVR